MAPVFDNFSINKMLNSMSVYKLLMGEKLPFGEGNAVCRNYAYFQMAVLHALKELQDPSWPGLNSTELKVEAVRGISGFLAPDMVPGSVAGHAWTTVACATDAGVFIAELDPTFADSEAGSSDCTRQRFLCPIETFLQAGLLSPAALVEQLFVQLESFNPPHAGGFSILLEDDLDKENQSLIELGGDLMIADYLLFLLEKHGCRIVTELRYLLSTALLPISGARALSGPTILTV